MAKKEADAAKLEEEMGTPGFWDDQDRAREVSSRAAELRSFVSDYKAIVSEATNVAELYDLALSEQDHDLQHQLIAEFQALRSKTLSYEIELYLNDELDDNNGILTIHPGAGGTESQDWALMLLRMYQRWVERKGFKSTVNDLQYGDEAGIKSATITVSGRFAYGLLKNEIGVHRLVRISPFDSNKRRHTSFASVDVIPELDDSIELEIDEKELRIDTYRSSGPGGQHVNTTDSAVRITHIPTNTVVQCQNERSQIKNKATAMKMLKGKLYQLEKESKRKHLDSLSGEKREIAWGSQIRSYVLYPYQLVKDHRTGVEKGNAEAVLDGDIDEFVEGMLYFSP